MLHTSNHDLSYLFTELEAAGPERWSVQQRAVEGQERVAAKDWSGLQYFRRNWRRGDEHRALQRKDKGKKSRKYYIELVFIKKRIYSFLDIGDQQTVTWGNQPGSAREIKQKDCGS